MPLLAACAVAGLLLAPGAAKAQLDPCFNHANGALCNDQNPCTLNDTCRDGWCRGDVAPNGSDCTDGNLCTTMDRCVFGLCVGQMVPEGSACDDNNMCTTGEICRSGTCTPQGNLQCNDNNPCTSELCIPAQGCLYTQVPMCVLPDGGMGGSGGGMGGSGGGMGGMGGAGGMSGGGGQDGGPDGGPNDDAGTGDAGVDAAKDARDANGDARDAAWVGDAHADAPVDMGITYEVEGGAWFCGFDPKTPGRRGGSALPLITGLAWLAHRLRSGRKPGARK